MDRDKKGRFIKGHKHLNIKGYKSVKNSLAKTGNKNPMFGNIKENPKKGALHQYVRKYKLSNGKCEDCQETKKLDLANKKPYNYLRQLSDWLWLCRKCHQNYDGNHPPKGENKGKKFPLEWRKNLSISHKGQIPWNKGLSL